MTLPPRAPWSACAAAFPWAPPLAPAHLVTTGAGPFYDGVAHFFVSLEQVLPVLAVALYAGLSGPRHGRWAVAAVAAGYVVGAAGGATAATAAPHPLAAPVLLLVCGALLAADLRLPARAFAAGAFVAGAFVGFTAAAGEAIDVIPAAGATTAACLVTCLASAVAVKTRGHWTSVVVRVAGSWLAALGLLALGWALRKPR